ncbi:MAG: hypothetical protein K2G13_00730, partial [Muribaculaceae bacterium]|nr:hypothetical protein [Muribaculaceae bacterium]
STINLGKDLQRVIDESQAIKAEDKQQIKDFCAGESGVSISTIVFFAAARSYVTGLLNDPQKFIAYMEKETGAKVVEENGAKVIASVAVIGNQFWACTAGVPDVDQLKYYQQLNDKQSYASADAASLLLDDDKVVTYVADVNRSMSLIPQATYLRVASSLIFNDMAYIAGSADLQKNDLKAYASVLNSEMKPAELLLPIEKIDASVIKSFEKGGDIYFAAGVPEKLTKKISDLAGTAMGANAKMFENVLGAIDGTVAVRCSSGAINAEAIIQTNGKNFNDLSSLLQSMMGLVVTRNGDTLTAVRGSKDFTGTITPAVAADKLKGSWIGVVTNGFIARDVTTVTKLSPDKKSLRLDLEAEGALDAIITALTK